MTSELEPALACQKANRLNDVEKICRRVLAADPEHPEALHGGVSEDLKKYANK